MTNSSLFSPKDLVDAERTALEQAIRFATLPLLAERDNVNNQKEIYPRGTGLLFSAEDRLFLVTAEHVLDEVGFDGLFFSPDPTTAPQVESFGSGIIFRHADEVDVVVIELTEATVIDTLRANWTVLTFNNVMKSGSYSGGDRIVSGYPYIEGRSSDWGIHQRLLVLATTDLESKPNVSTPTLYDAFFVLNKTGYNVWTGREENIPLLHGVSGGGIWVCINSAHQDIWKPLDSLKVIAIQVSMAEDQTWFRGSYWDAVADIFNSVKVGLANPTAAFGLEFLGPLSESHQNLDVGDLSIPPEIAD